MTVRAPHARHRGGGSPLASRYRMTKYSFLLALAAICCVSIYRTEVRLLSTSTPLINNDGTGTVRFALEPSDPREPLRNQTIQRPTRRKIKVIHWHGKDDLKTFMRAYFDSENMVCREILKDADTDVSHTTQPAMDETHYEYVFNVTFGCRRLFETAGLGTGNFMAGLYAMRLAARALSVSPRRSVRIETSCEDATEEQANLILPWLMGVFDGKAAVVETNRYLRLYPDADVLQKEACKHIDEAPIGLLYREIQYELRRMAVRLVGVPPSDHAMHATVQQWLDHHPEALFPHNRYAIDLDPREAPLYSNVSLDDAILHFRCGDLMDSNHPRFGFLRFDAFAKRIPQTAKSIGIVTQPFLASSGTVRALDSSATKRQRCQVVVTELVSYLQSRFPKARVQLHNSPDETIALTYARMVMAQATIAGISTFGVFASIASFGTGYIRRPDDLSATNAWLVHPKALDDIIRDETLSDNGGENVGTPQLALMDEPNILMVRKVRKIWLEENGRDKIVQWFRGEES